MAVAILACAASSKPIGFHNAYGGRHYPFPCLHCFRRTKFQNTIIPTKICKTMFTMDKGIIPTKDCLTMPPKGHRIIPIGGCYNVTIHTKIHRTISTTSHRIMPTKWHSIVLRKRGIMFRRQNRTPNGFGHDLAQDRGHRQPSPPTTHHSFASRWLQLGRMKRACL
mmetsp:Transcript_133109/g.265588  ORF Transcript_133109/g.265588 Transcript_133109/m.265588 type:complete len:166 (+) Transcript_133109:101-598(+)